VNINETRKKFKSSHAWIISYGSNKSRFERF